MESAEFKWREDDGRCPNCHNHCNLLEPSCEAGVRIAQRRLKKQNDQQEQNQNKEHPAIRSIDVADVVPLAQCPLDPEMFVSKQDICQQTMLYKNALGEP